MPIQPDEEDQGLSSVLSSKLSLVLAVFRKNGITEPKLYGDCASGSYHSNSPFEFCISLEAPDPALCSSIAAELQLVLGKPVQVMDQNDPEVPFPSSALENCIELAQYLNGPFVPAELDVEMDWRHSQYCEVLKAKEAEQQTVRVYALHDISQEKLYLVKRQMVDNFQQGPQVRVFETPDAYYALEGSHRLRAAFELVNETGDQKYNPVLVTFGPTDNIPHDLVNLPGDITQVQQIIAVHNSGLYYDFSGDISIYGHEQ